MSLFINSLQLLERRVGINLRRTDTLMSEQFLNTLQVCAVIQHRRGKGMPKHVGGAFLQGSNGRQILTYQAIHLRRRHPVSLVVQEESIAALLSLFVTDSPISVQGLSQLLSEGTMRCLFRLPVTFNCPVAKSTSPSLRPISSARLSPAS